MYITLQVQEERAANAIARHYLWLDRYTCTYHTHYTQYLRVLDTLTRNAYDFFPSSGLVYHAIYYVRFPTMNCFIKELHIIHVTRMSNYTFWFRMAIQFEERQVSLSSENAVSVNHLSSYVYQRYQGYTLSLYIVHVHI